MKLDPNPLDQYILVADKTAEESLVRGGPLVDGLRIVCEFIAMHGWPSISPGRPVSTLLAMNSYMLLLSAIRLALSAHASAVYPLLRTALESSCYSYLILRLPDLETTWLNRDDSPEARKACRRAFDAAVKEAVRSLNDEHPGSADFIWLAYEESITFGAHPNARSIFLHAKVEETDQSVGVVLTGLHDADALEAQRALIACLDFGTAISNVLRRGPGTDDACIEELNVLADVKRSAVERSGVA